jgi:hypothetical protein
MHQHKTIAQTFLVLSILNLVFAAPVVPRLEVRDRDNNMVVADDGTTVSKRRRDTPPGGTTPSRYLSSSSDGSPPRDSSPLEGSALLQGSAPSSESALLSHLSATDGQVPVHDSTKGASTSAHPLSAADGPAPEPGSITEASTSSRHLVTGEPVPMPDSTAEGSTTGHYTAVTLDMVRKKKKFYQKPMVQKSAGVALVVGVLIASALYGSLHNNNKDD